MACLDLLSWGPLAMDQGSSNFQVDGEGQGRCLELVEAWMVWVVADD